MNLMNSPRSIDLAITHYCNLRCSYCYYFDSVAEQGADLSTADWLMFFAELRQLAVMDVCLSGGEFFIRADIKELMSALQKNNIRFNILSNGTLITDEIAEFIAKTKRCNHIQISLDGAAAEMNDSCRGQGCFDQAIRGLKIVQRHEIPLTVRVTIHKHNVHHLPQIAQMLLEDLQLPSFSTNAAAYMGSCMKNAAAVMLDLDERMMAMETLLELNQKYKGRISAAAGPLAEARSWHDMELAKTGKGTMKQQCGALTSCGGVFSKLAVRADGTIIPCTQMPQIELGKINRDPLADIWQHHSELQRLRQRRNIPLENFAYCNSCDYVSFCSGSCPALAQNYFHTDEHPDNRNCYRQFLAAGGRLPDERFYA